MAEENTNQEEVSIKTGIGEFKARGSDILTTVFGVAAMCGFTIIIYGGYQHMAEAAKDAQNITAAVKESVAAQREMVNAQRETNCLARLTLEQRKRIEEIEFCRNLGRGR